MIATKNKLRVDAKHPKVTQTLRDLIVTGHYVLGQRLPHRDELEVELGASRVTVQTALNTLIAEGFLRSIAGTGTFVSERPPFLKDFAIVFPIPAEEFGTHRFYAALASQAKSIINQRQGVLHTYHSIHTISSDDYIKTLSDACAHRVAGIIFAAVPYHLHDSALLTTPGIPRVAVQQGQNSGFAGSCVYPDIDAMYGVAFERFVALGRQRVAVISCDPTRSHDTIGALAASYGLRCPEGHVLAMHPNWSRECRHLVSLLFSLPKNVRPDALLIADDNIVSDTTAGLLHAGINVPEELSVIAHGNLPLLPASHVPCDYVAFDAARVIQSCVDSIDAQRQGRAPIAMTLIEPKVLVHSKAASRSFKD
jgi:DNA-binding LacI/PurR family transcriptional regulator